MMRWRHWLGIWCPTVVKVHLRSCLVISLRHQLLGLTPSLRSETGKFKIRRKIICFSIRPFSWVSNRHSNTPTKKGERRHPPGTYHPYEECDYNEEHHGSCNTTCNVGKLWLLGAMRSNEGSHTSARWLPSGILDTGPLVLTVAFAYIWKWDTCTFRIHLATRLT